MLNSKTVFILGAGASYEVGFPLGRELKHIISKRLTFNNNKGTTNDVNITYLLNNKYRDESGQYLNTCQQISRGIILSDSIDDYIHKHSHDDKITTCGKLGIAFSIIEAENKSQIYVNQNKTRETIDFNALNDNWYSRFYSLISKGIPKEGLQNIFDNITIISFNYDRSLEHYLTHALSTEYMIGKDEATSLVNKLVICRPYGSINKSIPFGSNSIPDFDTLIGKLKTYTEQIEDSEELNQARQLIFDANILVFLGNAYHPNNMALLQVKCDKLNKVIYATRYSISDHDIPIIRSRIMNMLFSNRDKAISSITLKKIGDNNIYFADKCLDVFEQYRYSLSDL